jgi:ATP-dependent helicase HrpB
LADVDLRLRVEAVAGRPAGLPIEVDRGQVERLRRDAKEWRTRLGVKASSPVDPESAGTLLAWAYPDRIAQRRAGQAGRFLLRNGRGASMPPNQPLARAEYLAIAELDDVGADSRIILAAPLPAEEIDALVALHGEVDQTVEWDSAKRRVRAVERTRFGAIVVGERPIANPEPSLVVGAVKDGIRRNGVGSLRWTEDVIALRRRLAFLHSVDSSWPEVSDAGLLERLDPWLETISVAQLGRGENLDPKDWLLAGLDWDRRRALDRLAPERYQVPTGSAIAIDYADPTAPVLAVKLQEMFGETATPRIADGKVTLTIQLLSPAGRPLQVTRDLAGFWRSSYHDVRREMRGRYPKHEWPEDPVNALPTRRAKRRR